MNRNDWPAGVRALAGDLPPQATATFAIRIAAIAAELTCLLVLARTFGTEAYGSYAFAMSLVAVVVVPAVFGLDRLLVREVAAARASGERGLLKGLLVRSAWITVLASIAISSTLYVVAAWTELVRADLRSALALAALLVPIVALLRLQQAGLQGLGHVAVGLAPESLVQPIAMTTLAATVGIFAWAPRTADIALMLQICAAGAALTVATLLLRRRLPAGLAAEPARHRMKAWLAAGSVFMWLVGMSAALVNIDTLLVGMLLGPAQAGSYRVAGQLAMLVGFPLAAVSLAMAPSIAALHATGQREALRARARSAARVIVAVSLLIAVVVVVVGRSLLAALGPGFESAFPATLVLMAAYLFHASMATSTYLLFMTAHERLAAGIFTLGVAVNLAGGLLLIPRFGIVGGAIAAGTGLVLVSAASALCAWRKTGINATILGSARRTAST